MSLLERKIFNDAVNSSIEFISADYARLKVLEEEYTKLKMFLNIISERDFLHQKHVLTIELSDAALATCKNFEDVIRQALYNLETK